MQERGQKERGASGWDIQARGGREAAGRRWDEIQPLDTTGFEDHVGMHRTQGTQDWHQIGQDAAPPASDTSYIFADLLPSLLSQFPIGQYFPLFIYLFPSLPVPNWDTPCFLLGITGLVHEQRSLACLIPLLVLLVLSCRLYIYVLGHSCSATNVALHFDILGQDTLLCFICI